MADDTGHARMLMRHMLERIFARNRNNAAIPDGARVYAIGDIHGRADMLEELMRAIAAETDGFERTQLVFLGDYVDRGPDSRNVIDSLIATGAAQPKTIFLKGNHEASLLDFLSHPEDLPHWLDWGGIETLESYDVDPALPLAELAAAFRRALPKAHYDFLNALTLMHRAGDYLFVHAGIRPGTPIEKQTEEDLLWIRGRFHNAAAAERPECVVVHGHTPEDKPVDAGWRIGVDTGACYGGALTAVALEGRKRRFLSVRD